MMTLRMALTLPLQADAAADSPDANAADDDADAVCWTLHQQSKGIH